jgi:glutaredoxin
MLLKMLREGLGRVIIFIDWVVQPQKIERDPEIQQKVNEQVEGMTMYQLYACPFCIKTRRAMKRLRLPVQTRNVHIGSPYRQVLEKGGGRIQVPCLHIPQEQGDIWMYESSEIIDYVEKQFGDMKDPMDSTERP